MTLIESLINTGPEFASVVELEQRILKIRQIVKKRGTPTSREEFLYKEFATEADALLPNLSFGEMMLHRILLNKLYPPPPKEPFSLAT